MKKTISNQALVDRLKSRFIHHRNAVNQAKQIDRIYHRYWHEGTPKLTANNVLRIIRYVNHHQVPERDIGKAIDRMRLQVHPIVSRNMITQIYQQGYRDAKQSETLHAKTLDAIYSWIFNEIALLIQKGYYVKISGFGRFERYLEHARYFHSLSTGKKTYSKQHYVPKFRPFNKLRQKIDN